MANRGKFALTKQREAMLVGYIEQGVPIKVAVLACGIKSRKTFYRWMKKGSEAKSGAYREFYEKIQHAEARAEAATFVNLKAVSKKAGPAEEAKTLRWTLERRFGWKDERRTELVVEGAPDASPIPVSLISQMPGMTPQQLAALAGNDLDVLGAPQLDDDEGEE